MPWSSNGACRPGTGNDRRDGHVGLLLPGVPQFVGDQFTAESLLAPGTPQFIAAFTVSASYEEGEDGTAASYGTASAFFNSASIVAQVSAIALPEPAGFSLWLLGGFALAAAQRPSAGPTTQSTRSGFAGPTAQPRGSGFADSRRPRAAAADGHR
ncbi:MAG: hypothetical protein V5B33_18925 [Candidatus Accumulibacter sp. UW20]|jgi:hypothetical protein